MLPKFWPGFWLRWEERSARRNRMKEVAGNIGACPLSPGDGYRVVARDCIKAAGSLSEAIEVWLELCSDAEVVYVRRLWRSQTRDLIDRGRQSRMFAFVQAIARFLNAGGTLAELADAVDCLVSDPEFAEVIYPGGYYLVHTKQDVPEVQHIFVNPTEDSAIIFVEDSYVRRVPLDKLIADSCAAVASSPNASPLILPHDKPVTEQRHAECQHGCDDLVA
jgi:hypothetical protein